MFYFTFFLGGAILVGGLGAVFALRQSGRQLAGDILLWVISAVLVLGIYLGWETKGIAVLLPPFAMQEAIFFLFGVDWQGTQECARGYNC